jgi:isoquinoline 1-oxidoreductase beta subunit
MGLLEAAENAHLSRRAFVMSALFAGGSLVIGSPTIGAAQAAGATALNPFIRIPAVGKIELVSASVEMGQGVYMSLSTLLAEELEVTLDQIVAVPAPADARLYAHPILQDQITGGSVTIRGYWEPMLRAGATARMMLIAAAAREWGVPPASCRAESGVVIHTPSGRRLVYGALAEKAAGMPVPQNVTLKPARDYKLIGKQIRRVDTPAKVDGSAQFGLDARPPGVKFAAITICPTFGGTLATVDDGETLKVKGVSQVVKLRDAVAVVASHTAAARKGLAALKITWDRGANASLSTEELERRIDAALAGDAVTARNDGDVAAAEARYTGGVDAVYRLPILPHTAMEPMNCTVAVRRDGCDVWVGTQVADRARKAVAEVTRLPVESVTIHNHFLGGGFGRRLDHDGVVMAARVAQQVDGPVQVVWSREEDVRHDSYRYLNLSRISIRLGPDGMPVSWRHRVAGPAIMARFLPIFFKDGIDFDIIDAAEGPYEIGNKRVEFARHEGPNGMLTGNWRGVGATRNGPAVECGIDEAAHLARIDPVDYRRRLLANNPRLKAVLDLAASRSGWGGNLGPNRGRGVALLSAFGSFAALVAQIHVDQRGTLKVERIVAAVDCGIVVNPDVVRQQVESGVIYGLSAALYGRLTIHQGAVVESNFDDQPVLRMQECPAIETHLVESAEAPGGVGELATPGVAPAVMNAIFASTGKRIRSLPIDTNALRGS